MEKAIQNKENPKKIIKKYGWIKARNLFDKGLNENDLKNIGLENKQKHIRPNIPKKLKKLFNEIQELVYLRTARTDVFYEFLFRAQPLLRDVAKYYNIKEKELKDYSIHDLIKGKPKKINPVYCICYKVI